MYVFFYQGLEFSIDFKNIKKGVNFGENKHKILRKTVGGGCEKRDTRNKTPTK